MLYTPKLANGKVVPLPWPLYAYRLLNAICWPLKDGVSIAVWIMDRVIYVCGFLIFLGHNDAEGRYLYQHFANMDELLTGMPTYLILAEVFLRAFQVGLHKEGLKNLLKEFYKDIYIDQHENPNIFYQIQRKLRPTSIVSAGYCSTLGLYCYVAISNWIHDIREPIFKMVLLFDHTPSHIFYFIILANAWVGVIVVMTLIGDLYMILQILLNLNGRFVCLREDVEKISPGLLEDGDPATIAYEFQIKMRSIIARTSDLYKFAAKVQAEFSYRIFISFAFSAALLCVLGFKVYTNPGQGIIFVCWGCAKILELISTGEIGSTLMKTTSEVSCMFFNSKWELIIEKSSNTYENVRLMKLILIAMKTSDKSLYLTGLSFFSVSLGSVIADKGVTSSLIKDCGHLWSLPRKLAVVDTAGDYQETVVPVPVLKTVPVPVAFAAVQPPPLSSHCAPPPEPPYQRLTKALQCDPRCGHEVTIGRRIGLYRFCGDIGRGNFSKVKLAAHQLTRDKVAIKVVDRSGLDSKALRMLSSEIGTLECVHHPNILRLFEVIEALGRMYLVTEWIRGGELYNHITQGGPLRETQAVPLYKQLLLAVKHMHSLGFVHRDIKAENVLLLSEDRLKLADFGFSTQLINGANQKLDTFCGSPPYAAPELFSDDHYVGAPVDVWALGILLFFMVVGNMPFRAPTIPGLKAAILKGDYLLPGQLSLPCIRLIQRILIHMPARRPTIDDMLNSQFTTCPKLSAELMQHEINLRTKPVKRSRFWMRPKSNRMRKTNSLRDRYMEVTNKPPIPMNTKSNDGVFADNFLHPVELYHYLPSESNEASKKALNTPKRTLFCGTQKKKVSPMGLEKEKQLPNGHKLGHGLNGSTNASEKKQWSSEVALSCPLFKNYDIETGNFVMLPTDTDDLTKLSPLELEARHLLDELGVTSEMLQAAAQNGPRSDIIGAYRIIINRLQKQSWLARKHVELALQEMPKSEKKMERTCCIL